MNKPMMNWRWAMNRQLIYKSDIQNNKTNRYNVKNKQIIMDYRIQNK